MFVVYFSWCVGLLRICVLEITCVTLSDFQTMCNYCDVEMFANLLTSLLFLILFILSFILIFLSIKLRCE